MFGLRNEWSKKSFSPAQLEVWVRLGREPSGHVVFQSSLVFELLSAIVWPAWSGWHSSQLCVRSVVLWWTRKEWSRKGFSHTRPRVWVQVCRRSPGHVMFHSSGVFFLPSTTWPVPPTLHVFFLKVKVVLVWTEHLKAWTFFWKRSKILPVPCEHSLKRCPLY